MGSMFQPLHPFYGLSVRAEGDFLHGTQLAAPASSTPSPTRQKHGSELPLRPPQAGGNYTYPDGGWQDEELGWPRVMGDATVLPNGDVVLLNGAAQARAPGRQQGLGCTRQRGDRAM